jgi:hypothetical protein
MAGTAIGLVVLWGLKAAEMHIPEEKAALLVLVTKSDGPAAADIRARLHRSGFRIAKFSETIVNTDDGFHTMHYNLRWRAKPQDTNVPAAVTELAHAEGVQKLQWKP